MKYVLATLKREVSWEAGEQFASTLKSVDKATFPCRELNIEGLEREFIAQVPIDSQAVQIYIQIEDSGLFENTEIIADKIAKNKTLSFQSQPVSAKSLN